MPFKVRCKLVQFMGDVEHFTCHFDYNIGDEIIFNGEKFEGRVCPGCFSGLARVIPIVMYSACRHSERIIFRYSGLSAKDPSMKQYDGIGFRPLKKPLEGTEEKYLQMYSGKLPEELIWGWGFVCEDVRTAARFLCEPIGLADGGDSLPYYKREMSILEKIKTEPGLTADEILDKFTEWEMEEIYPPLHPLNVQLMLDELAAVNYIEIRDSKAYPKNSPS